MRITIGIPFVHFIWLSLSFHSGAYLWALPDLWKWKNKQDNIVQQSGRWPQLLWHSSGDVSFTPTGNINDSNQSGGPHEPLAASTWTWTWPAPGHNSNQLEPRSRAKSIKQTHSSQLADCLDKRQIKFKVCPGQAGCHLISPHRALQPHLHHHHHHHRYHHHHHYQKLILASGRYKRARTWLKWNWRKNKFQPQQKPPNYKSF